jgi:hypothetical protein
LSGALDLSNLDLILTEATPPAQPPVSLVGRELEHTWCYYFEKADLARQRGDWRGISALGEEVQAGGFKPTDLSEWMPFIQAYARTGKVEQARALADQVMKQENLRPVLCKSVKDVLTEFENCSE